MASEQTLIHHQLRELAPKLAEMADEVVLGDVWRRGGLSKRDRSLVTVSALVAQSRPELLETHLRFAFDNGVTQDELVEVITHMAIYAGFPSAISSMLTLKRILDEDAPEP